MNNEENKSSDFADFLFLLGIPFIAITLVLNIAVSTEGKKNQYHQAEISAQTTSDQIPSDDRQKQTNNNLGKVEIAVREPLIQREQNSQIELNNFYQQNKKEQIKNLEITIAEIQKEQNKENPNLEKIEVLQKKIQNIQLNIYDSELAYKNSRTLEQFHNLVTANENKRDLSYQAELKIKQEKIEKHKERENIFIEKRLKEEQASRISNEIIFLKEQLNRIENENKLILSANKELIHENNQIKEKLSRLDNEKKGEKKPFKEAPDFKYESWSGIK